MTDNSTDYAAYLDDYNHLRSVLVWEGRQCVLVECLFDAIEQLQAENALRKRDYRLCVENRNKLQAKCDRLIKRTGECTGQIDSLIAERDALLRALDETQAFLRNDQFKTRVTNALQIIDAAIEKYGPLTEQE